MLLEAWFFIAFDIAIEPPTNAATVSNKPVAIKIAFPCDLRLDIVVLGR